MTPVLVPYRSDGSWRARCWEFVQERWAGVGIGPVVTGDTEGPFSRAGARNAAAAAAEPWDVAVFADADTFMLQVAPLHEAIDLAARTGKVVLPHDTFIGLTNHGTRQLLLRRRQWRKNIKRTLHGAPLGVVVVPWSAWQQLRGFDERFHGWGGEDVAFRVAASTLPGLARLPGTIVHLWHPNDPTKAAYVKRRGGTLRQMYRDASGKPAAMRTLLEGRQ